MDLKGIYTELIVRDAVGYVAPGSVAAVALAIHFLGGPKPFLEYVKDLSWVAWVPALAIAYLLGHGIQGLIFDVWSPNRVFRYHLLTDDVAFERRLVDFNRALANEPQGAQENDRLQRERFVALKHATANGAGAVIIAGAVLLLPRLLYRADPQWWLSVLGAIPICLLALGLWFSHYRIRHRQDAFERSVIDGPVRAGGQPAVDRR